MNKETEKIMKEIEEFDPDKAELESFRREKTLKENLEKELEILLSIFPDITAEDIPDEVFSATDNGRGLAAQYALFHIKSEKEKEEQKNTNEKNNLSAPPEIKSGSDEVFFTPEMVKKMTQEEIKRNYRNIMKSMEKWTGK